MKFITVFLFCISLPISLVNDTNKEMDPIRINYTKAVSDKKVCKTMIEQLELKNGNSLSIAYLGAFKTIWANHAVNPIVKLNSFNKGKKYIETAVKEDSLNVEIRFIRLSVQKNCPAFLGYNKHIDMDSKFIAAHKNSIKSGYLKKMIAELFENQIP